jgi:hypothetical protein
MDRVRHSRTRSVLGFFLITLPLSGILTLAAAELAFRIVDPEFLAVGTSDFTRWQHDADLGWNNVPNTSGTYTNGHFHGFVTTDQFGNRENSRQGTYVAGYANILFTGDSRTVSFEVDDDQTVPALVEQGLRARGQQYNVINLGVSGYGTDQAILKAIEFSARYRPTDIIYLFTDTDNFDNNVLSPIGGRMVKGVYLRDGGGDTFKPYNYPVPQQPPGYVGVVVFDRDCHPHIYENPDPPGVRLERRLDETLGRFYVYRGYKLLRKQLGKLIARTVEPDPYDEVLRGGFTRDFANEYGDGGSVRIRCRSYFDDQMRFLMRELRAHTAGAPRIHVVEFPHNHTMRMLAAGEETQNGQVFEFLRAEGVLDTFVDLSREKVDIRKYRCPGDGHFCAEGNRWLAGQIVEKVHFD